MTSTINQAKLSGILSRVLGVREETIDDDTSMKTTSEWDSLKHIEIVTALEEELGVPQFSLDEIVEITSVRRIKEVLKAKGLQI
jgi:acyl carrier protein